MLFKERKRCGATRQLVELRGCGLAAPRLATYQRIACGAYLIVVMITIVYNAPRNDALARLDPAGTASHEWTAYSVGWTAWNHARAAGVILAGGNVTAALRDRRTRPRSEKLIDSDGKRADAPTGGVVDRVGDGRRHANDSNLAEPLHPDLAERVGRADEHDVELGDVRVDRNQVVAEGRVGDTAGTGIEDHPFDHGHADAHHEASDDLAAGALRVEDAG